MKSAFRHGKAFKRMERGKYESAARLLESVCNEVPEHTNSEYTYYNIGECYFRMGKLDTALIWLSKSHDQYSNHIDSNKDVRYLRAYRDMLQLYCKALRINHQNELADKISLGNDFGS